MALKIVFMGTPEFAVPTLAAVRDAGHHILAVYSRPPRPAGRGMDDRPSPVQEFAKAAGLRVLTPPSLKGAAEQTAFAEHGADAAVIVAYGLILPKAVLDAPRLGCFNLHPSALPRWRGAAPIQRPIMAGDSVTGVNIMRMVEGLDTGPVCLAEAVAIPPEATAGEMHDRLATIGARMMVEALAALQAGTLWEVPQSQGGVTYAAKIAKAEARIDFTCSAVEVHNKIRGLSPFPGAWFEAAAPGGKPERIKVLRSRLMPESGELGVVLDDNLTVACADGAVRLVELQRAGRKPMQAEEFMRGFALSRGARIAGNSPVAC